MKCPVKLKTSGKKLYKKHIYSYINLAFDEFKFSFDDYKDPYPRIG